MGFCGFGQCLTVDRQHRLVRGYDVFAGGNCGLGRGLGGAVFAAHEFDKDIDIVARGKRDGIVLPGVGRNINAAVARFAACGHGRDGDRATRPRRHEISVGLDDLHDACADCSQSGNPKAKRLCHGVRLL